MHRPPSTHRVVQPQLKPPEQPVVRAAAAGRQLDLGVALDGSVAVDGLLSPCVPHRGAWGEGARHAGGAGGVGSSVEAASHAGPDEPVALLRVHATIARGGDCR